MALDAEQLILKYLKRQGVPLRTLDLLGGFPDKTSSGPEKVSRLTQISLEDQLPDLANLPFEKMKGPLVDLMNLIVDVPNNKESEKFLHKNWEIIAQTCLDLLRKYFPVTPNDCFNPRDNYEFLLTNFESSKLVLTSVQKILTSEPFLSTISYTQLKETIETLLNQLLQGENNKTHLSLHPPPNLPQETQKIDI